VSSGPLSSAATSRAPFVSEAIVVKTNTPLAIRAPTSTTRFRVPATTPIRTRAPAYAVAADPSITHRVKAQANK
jgi:hypothetical protein